MRKIISALFFVLCAYGVYGQQQITGTIYEEVNGVKTPLPFANVFIPGTTRGATSDFDGKYEVVVYENDTLIKVSYMGYNDVVKTIDPNHGDLIVDVVMSSDDAAQNLEGVTVVAEKNLENENMLLLEQKKAIIANQSIGAVELSRKGVGNAEDALTKVSGVTKQEGVKNVFVRGLGDRYNSTSLNGLPLPSDDPEYKNISLDIFSSDIINNIGVNKTFSTAIYGDVGGANVDIASKELFKEKELQISLSTGVNLSTVSESEFLTIDGSNTFGTVKEKEHPISDFQKYDFTNSWNPNKTNSVLNNSISLMGGKQFKIGDNTLSAFVVGAYDGDYSYREGISRSVNAQGNMDKDFEFDRYSFSTSSIGMANLKYDISSGMFKRSIAYNGMFISSNSQVISEYEGSKSDYAEVADGELYINHRQQENNNNLLVNQLLADLEFEKIDVDFGASYNIVKGTEPDRRVNAFKVTEEDGLRMAKNGPTDNHRFYSNLDEKEFTTRLLMSYKIGKQPSLDEDADHYGSIQIGYNGRFTHRRFEDIAFGHTINSSISVADMYDIDAILNQEGSDNGDFELISMAAQRNTMPVPDYDDMYKVQRNIHAAILNFNYTLNPQLSFTLGLRYELVSQNIDWDTPDGFDSESDANGDDGIIDKDFILPSFALKYSVTENNIIRLAASKTYTMPQFKEVACFRYEGADFTSLGNPDLTNSDNYNVDVKYEHYFKPGEIIAVTGFYKYIKNPINRSDVNSASNELGYLNSGDKANAAGIELEFRKKIISAETLYGMHKLMFGLNGSYIYTNQELTNPDASFKNDEGQLQGASPILLNADLSYNTKGDNFTTTSTITTNYFSDRVYSLGTQGREDIIENSSMTLDFIFKLSYRDHWGVKFSAKNLIDPKYKLTRKVDSGDNVIVNSYKKGRKISIGVTYKF